MKRSDFTAAEYWEAQLALIRAIGEDTTPSEHALLRRRLDTLFELQFRAAAAALERSYGKHPFYAARAQTDPRYWRDLASSAACAGTRPVAEGFEGFAARWAKDVRTQVRERVLSAL